MHSSQYFATAVTGEVINCEVSVIEDAVDMKKVTKQSWKNQLQAVKPFTYFSVKFIKLWLKWVIV